MSTVTSRPSVLSIVRSRAVRMPAPEPLASKTTLPLWMYVRTRSCPGAANTSRSWTIGSWRPPRLTPRSSARRAAIRLGTGKALVLVEHVRHDRTDELVGLVGHPAFDTAVDRGAERLVVLVLVRVCDRVLQVGRERVRQSGLRLRTGHRHVNRVGVLLAVEPPTLRPHVVVHVVDVEL